MPHEKKELEAKTREELDSIAKELGLDAGSYPNIKMVTDAILKKQKESTKPISKVIIH